MGSICPADYTDCVMFVPALYHSPVDAGNDKDDLVGGEAMKNDGDDFSHNDPLGVPYWREAQEDLGAVQADATEAAAEPTGTSAITCLIPTMSATGEVPATGTSAITCLMPTMSASGSLTYESTSAFTLPVPTSTATGEAAHPGTSAIDLLLPTMDATGVADTEQAGTSAIDLLIPTMSSSGEAAHTATSAFTAPVPTSTATGTVTTSTEPVGTGAFTIPLVEMTSTGITSTEQTATSAFEIPLPTMDATGASSGAITATSAFTLPVVQMLASAEIPDILERNTQVGVRVPRMPIDPFTRREVGLDRTQWGQTQTAYLRRLVARSTPTSDLSFLETGTLGDILYRGANGWNRLSAGETGDVLTMIEGEPRWVTPTP
jgi:hypothetical protein